MGRSYGRLMYTRRIQGSHSLMVERVQSVRHSITCQQSGSYFPSLSPDMKAVGILTTRSLYSS